MRRPLQILLRPAERARLDALAEADGIPRGEIVRGLIDREYAQRFSERRSPRVSTRPGRKCDARTRAPPCRRRMPDKANGAPPAKEKAPLHGPNMQTLLPTDVVADLEGGSERFGIPEEPDR